MCIRDSFKVNHQISLQQLRLNIKQQRDWFDFSGELRLEDDSVMDLRRLLELLEQTPGRFVPQMCIRDRPSWKGPTRRPSSTTRPL